MIREIFGIGAPTNNRGNGNRRGHGNRRDRDRQLQTRNNQRRNARGQRAHQRQSWWENMKSWLSGGAREGVRLGAYSGATYLAVKHGTRAAKGSKGLSAWISRIFG